MVALWQSSWFWLMICTLLLILAGCVVFNGHNSYTRQADNSHLMSLANTPLPTLLPPDIIQTPFLPGLIAPLQINQRNTSPSGRDIIVDIPTCYSLSSGEFSCLGQIWNNSAENMGDTQIQLAFFDSIGHKIGEQTATSEQRITESGSFAPYRAIISANLANNIDSEAYILSSIVNSFPVDSNLRTLRIIDSRGYVEAGRYHLTVTIQNDSGFVAREIRLFTTLRGDKLENIGYNIHEVENILNNGEQQLLQVEIIPHAIPQRIEHSLHIEALISN